MKTFSFDQFEFDRSDTEENLEVAVSTISEFPHPTVASFVASAIGVSVSQSLPEPKPFKEHYGYGFVRGYLERYAGIVLPIPCAWPTYVITDTENEFHAVIEGSNQFISYLWSTSA